jgi:hypothetical protein
MASAISTHRLDILQIYIPTQDRVRGKVQCIVPLPIVTTNAGDGIERRSLGSFKEGRIFDYGNQSPHLRHHAKI